MHGQPDIEVVPPLEAARRRAGIPLRKIARELNVSLPSVHRYLQGERTAPDALYILLGVEDLRRQDRAHRDRLDRPRIEVELPVGMSEEHARRICTTALAEVRGRLRSA